MSIILDSHRLTERSYLGFLENAIILSLAKAMPDEVFLIPKEKNWNWRLAIKPEGC